MADAQNDQEPSIEEILASIREIISDDDQPAKAEEPVPAPAPAPVPAPVAQAPAEDDDDILDLAAFADEPAAPVVVEDDNNDPLAGIDFDKPTEQTVDFTEPEEIIVAEVEPEPQPEPEPAPEAEPTPAPAPTPYVSNFDASPVDTDSLLTDSAKSASLDSLTRLAQNIAISRAGNGGTLEDIVREMLKPMLAQWLDTNLPPMIERMVEIELERLVKQALDR